MPVNELRKTTESAWLVEQKRAYIMEERHSSYNSGSQKRGGTAHRAYRNTLHAIRPLKGRLLYMADKKKALDALNKLNNYSRLPADHRWVSTVRHYIKEAGRTVRPRRAAQQGKAKIGLGTCRECLDFNYNFCHRKTAHCVFKQRPTSAVA